MDRKTMIEELGGRSAPTMESWKRLSGQVVAVDGAFPIDLRNASSRWSLPHRDRNGTVGTNSDPDAVPRARPAGAAATKNARRIPAGVFTIVCFGQWSVASRRLGK